MYTAGTLSQFPLPMEGDASTDETDELVMQAYTSNLPASCLTLNVLEQVHCADPVCFVLIQYS